MKKIALLLVILALIFCFASCDKDGVEEIIERLPYDIEGWHEHSWDNWELVYDEVNVNLVCSFCEANVKSQPISQGLEIDENGVLVGVGTCKDAYIVVPQGVTAVGEGAFSNTKDILGVLLPDTVTEIRDNAFKSCDGLQVINIPEGVTEIGDSAFHSCKSLIGVLVPHSVTKIGKQAFANCGYLEIIYYIGTEADWTNVEKGQNWDQGAGKHVIEFKKPSSGDTPTPPPTPHEHKYSAVVTEPTCTAQGYTTYTCECGDFYVADYVDAKGHSFGEWTIVTEPTIEAEGLKERYCNCGEKESEPIAKLEKPAEPEGSQGLEYALNADGQSYSVVGIGTCTDTNLVIPSEYNGLPVTKIGDMAFYYRLSFVSVEIPDSVTTIGYHAFAWCHKLTEVTIPKSVVSIDYGPFAECRQLVNIYVEEGNEYYKSIEGNLYTIDGTKLIQYAAGKQNDTFEIPETVTIIGAYSIDNCGSIKQINMPKSVTTIEKAACYNSGRLVVINYSGTIDEWKLITKAPFWDDNTGNYTVYCTDGTIAKDGTVTYYEPEPQPEGSQGLEYALNADGQSYSVVGIGTCTDTELVIPSEYNGLPVTIIGEGAFLYLQTVDSIVIPKSVTTIKMGAFAFCGDLENVTISDSVTIVEECVFMSCSLLKEIKIPASVSYIGHTAFMGCDNLLSIEADVHNNFYASLNGNLYNKDKTILIQYATGKPEKSFEVPSSVTTIGIFAFGLSETLENIILPDSVIDIQESAFNECRNLLNINIPNSVVNIGANAFTNCNSLENITLGNSVQIIGDGAFLNCDSLVNINIPNSVVSIGDEAFQYCKSLVEIEIPNSVVHLGAGVFTLCSSLETVVLGNGIAELKSSTLPVTPVMYFGMFELCKALKTITFEGTIEQWNSVSKDFEWDYNTDNYTIYCTDGTIAKDGTVTYYEPEPQPEGSQGLEYALNADGQSYSVVGIGTCTDTNLVIPSEYNGLPVTNIGANAFKECQFIVSVVIMEGIENIYQNSFRNCINLEKVEFPDSLRFIEGFAGESVFYGCKKLLVSENGIYYVDNWVIAVDFNTVPDCVTIKEGTIAIGMHGLIGLPSSKIVIPESVKIICWNGILFADNLNTVFYLGNADDWNAIDIGEGNEIITDAARYHYSESEPTTEGNYWHYVEGVPTIWGASDEQPEETPEASQGLEYALNEDGKSYSVAGIGTCTDTELVIPSMYEGLPVTKIGDCAFASVDEYYNPREPYNIVSVKLPETIKMIGIMAFAGIPTLTNVEIPESIEEVGTYAFTGSEMLEFTEYGNALYLGNEDNPYLVLVAPKNTDIVTCEINNLTKVIVDISFNGCYSLETVYVGNGVKYISGGAFMACSLLKNVIFSENNTLIGIGDMAFMGCNIEKIILPDTVESIGGYAFATNESLNSITISNSLKTIDTSAFGHCSSLEKIVIPESVENIGEYAFEWCSALTIYCEIEAQPNEWNVNWNSKGAFSGDQFIPVIWGYDGTNDDLPPEGSQGLEYALNEDGKSYSVVGIGTCTDTDIVIPSMYEGLPVTSIGAQAFHGCASLASINIPNSVTSIGGYAFSYCTSLTSIVIPNSVIVVGEFAFMRCDSIIVFCEASSQPSGWSPTWISLDKSVIWGYQPE